MSAWPTSGQIAKFDTMKRSVIAALVILIVTFLLLYKLQAGGAASPHSLTGSINDDFQRTGSFSTISGHGKPGAVVELKVDGQVENSAQVDADGRWQMDIERPDGSYEIQALFTHDGKTAQTAVRTIDFSSPENVAAADASSVNGDAVEDTSGEAAVANNAIANNDTATDQAASNSGAGSEANDAGQADAQAALSSTGAAGGNPDGQTGSKTGGEADGDSADAEEKPSSVTARALVEGNTVKFSGKANANAKLEYTVGMQSYPAQADANGDWSASRTLPFGHYHFFADDLDGGDMTEPTVLSIGNVTENDDGTLAKETASDISATVMFMMEDGARYNPLGEGSFLIRFPKTLFVKDSDQLTNAGRAQLTEVAQQFAGGMQRDPQSAMLALVHDADSKELSIRRAATVHQLLTSNGVPKSRLKANGVGSDEPLLLWINNDTPAEDVGSNTRLELYLDRLPYEDAMVLDKAVREAVAAEAKRRAEALQVAKHEVTGNRVTITGKGDPNSVVSFYNGPAVIGVATADENGNWTVVTTLPEGRYRLAGYMGGPSDIASAHDGDQPHAEVEFLVGKEQDAPSPEMISATEAREKKLTSSLDQELQSGAAVMQRLALDKIRVSIAGDITFASGSATVKPLASQTFVKVAKALADDPKNKVFIIGHTDADGAAGFNQKLSEKRAKAVAKVLADAGIERKQMAIFGRGESEPIATNATAEGKAKNRRVDLIVAATR